MPRLVIVGGGIVGLGTARAALKRGFEVTVLDQSPIPNEDGASCDRHRMIRPHYGSAGGYSLMVDEAFAAWDRLWDDLGACHYAETGAIAISLAPGDYAEQTLATFRHQGRPHRRLDRAEIEAEMPHLRLPAHAWGVVAGPAGPLFADRIMEGLAAWLRGGGARLREREPVTGWDARTGHVALESGESLAADHIVIAAGAWLPGLAPDEWRALTPHRQTLLYSEPPAAYRESWRAAPAIAVLGDHTGYTLPDRGGAGLKFGCSAHRRPCPPDHGFAQEEGEAEAIFAPFRPYLRRADDYRVLRLKTGYYVMDPSRRFRVEAQGRATVVTNCDGQMFKFGPLVGEKVVEAIEGRLAPETLAAWARAETYGA